MSFLSKKSKPNHTITFKKLSEVLEQAPLAAKWATEEWGYLQGNKRDYSAELQYRENAFRKYPETLYIGFIGEPPLKSQPVAMFVLRDKKWNSISHEKKVQKTKVSELLYVYVDKPYRELGIGSQIVEYAKQLARVAECNSIHLNTFKPKLNPFYEKKGARVIGEKTVYDNPTELLTITVSP